MNKVIVIGCPGAGKSTFARALAAATGLELHYLDMLWHKPDKTNITREEFDSALARIMSDDGWIIDGNYTRTLEMRLRECDTVFMLDLSTEICLEGARSRVGKKREDMAYILATGYGVFDNCVNKGKIMFNNSNGTKYRRTGGIVGCVGSDAGLGYTLRMTNCRNEAGLL